MQGDLSSDIQKVKKTFEQLRASTDDLQHHNESLIDVFIFAQKCENQLDFIQSEHDKEVLKQSKEYQEIEQNKQEVYKKTYTAYDRLVDEEITQMIVDALEVRMALYKDKITIIGEMSEEKLISMLFLRDEIKILLDELKVWLDKFKPEDRREFESSSDLYQKIEDLDQKLKDELVINARFYQGILDTARQNLVKRPDGSRRFNFWWWYAGN